MGYSTLIRYALWALLIAACTWFVLHVAGSIRDSIYQNGRLAERAEWQEKEFERAKQLGREIADSVSRLNAERDKQINALTGALDHESQAKDKLNRDINTVRVANRGLWIDAQNCANRADETTGKAESTGVGSGSTGRIKLPRQVEQDLWELAADAQRVVIQYETCRGVLLPMVEVVSDTGG